MPTLASALAFLIVLAAAGCSSGGGGDDSAAPPPQGSTPYTRALQAIGSAPWLGSATINHFSEPASLDWSGTHELRLRSGGRYFIESFTHRPASIGAEFEVILRQIGHPVHATMRMLLDVTRPNGAVLQFSLQNGALPSAYGWLRRDVDYDGLRGRWHGNRPPAETVELEVESVIGGVVRGRLVVRVAELSIDHALEHRLTGGDRAAEILLTAAETGGAYDVHVHVAEAIVPRVWAQDEFRRDVVNRLLRR